jgi:hypothetical protein
MIAIVQYIYFHQICSAAVLIRLASALLVNPPYPPSIFPYSIRHFHSPYILQKMQCNCTDDDVMLMIQSNVSFLSRRQKTVK